MDVWEWWLGMLRARACQLANYPCHQIVHGLQGFGAFFGVVVYLGLLGVAQPRQLSYPGGLVRDVPLVEGGQARGLQAVVGVPVARGRGGRMVRNLGCHVSKERLATRNSSSNEHPGFPAFHVGAIIASFGAEVPSSALVVGVITKVPTPGGEPVIPAWGHEGFVLDAAEVLTDEGGPVASRIEARCHVVLLVGFVPVRLPTSSPPTDVFVGPYPGVVGILAAHDGGPTGTAKCVGDEGVRKAHALSLKHGASLWHVLEVAFSHVVGEDEDDVGFGGERLGIWRHAAREAQREQHS